VKIRFVAGVPRDQFVDVSISPVDATTSKAKRGLNIGGFAYLELNLKQAARQMFDVAGENATADSEVKNLAMEELLRLEK
jgi:hypothetical protein